LVSTSLHLGKRIKKLPPVLALKNICRYFSGIAAVDDVSLEVRRGEILGIIGRSGAGKSTLIRCLNGLEPVDQGEIFFDGMLVSDSSGQRTRWRDVQRKIGMIFQHFNLLSSRKILDNVALPLKLRKMPKALRRTRALDMLDLVGLADKANHYPSALSGGQKQRVGIARALASRPDLLLSDEATSALDPETTHSILELLEKINKQMHLTIMLITHEMEVIRKLSHRVIVLDQGRIVEEGAVRDVIVNPQSTTTKALLASLTPQLPTSIACQLQPNLPPSLDVNRDFEVIFELHLRGERACMPFLYQLHERTGLVARLIQGGVEHVQGEAIGHFFLAVVLNEAEHLAQLNLWLKANADRSEVLGFVPV